MKKETAKALDSMRRAVAKMQGVDESKVEMTVCLPTCAYGHDWIENLFGDGVVCETCGIKQSERELAADFDYPPEFYEDDDRQECECGVIGCPECDERARDNYDCGMMQNGLCTKAGSEDCDWDCPFNK